MLPLAESHESMEFHIVLYGTIAVVMTVFLFWIVIASFKRSMRGKKYPVYGQCVCGQPGNVITDPFHHQNHPIPPIVGHV
jgi:hypothetical protein